MLPPHISSFFNAPTLDFTESPVSSAKFQIISLAICNSVEPSTSDFNKLIISHSFPTMHLTFQPYPTTIWNHWTHHAYSPLKSPPMYVPPLIFYVLSVLMGSYITFKIQIKGNSLYISPAIIIHSPTCACSVLDHIYILTLIAEFDSYVHVCLTCHLDLSSVT